MAGQPKLKLSAASALLLVLTAWMVSSPPAVADEAQARTLLKAMTDYVGAQQSIAFDYDATLEVVTKDRQKLQLASSGTVSLARPDKIRTTRSGGFVDMETVFDGKTLTLFGKNKNLYTQVEVPGSLDNLVNELQKKFDRPLPAADSVHHPFLRRDHGRRHERQGPWQRGRRRHRVRLLRLPRQRRGLADLGDARRETTSVPVRHHVHRNHRRAAVHRPASELEDRQRGRHAGLYVQATVWCEADWRRRAQEGEGHGRVTEQFHPWRQVMSTTRTLRALLLLVIVALGAIELGDRMSIPVLTGLATMVKAEVGRPRSPVSVAGVARRSARRD